MIRRSIVGAVIAATLLLGGCGGGGGGGNSSNAGPKALIAVPNVKAGTNFSFDISEVDSARGRMYFTDRNNKSVDVIDIKTNTFLKQIMGGFAGCNTGPTCVGASNPKSGPDGINRIPGTTFLYVGDVNSVKIIDTQTDTVVNTIAIGGSSGNRADEGCYDPDHKIFMIASPDEAIPFATFIDTTTQKIIATLFFTDPGTGLGGHASAGLEACVYDHGTASFLVNNDGSTANPDGEVDVIPAAAILVGTPAAPVTLTLPAIAPGNGFKVFPLGNCDPTGIDLGPGTDLVVACRQNTGQLTTQILNRTNGAVLATINFGGSDQVVYDPSLNRYYLGASRWTANGLSAGSAGCSAVSPCTPVLGIIDAVTRTLIATPQSGNNAHSVTVDATTHQVYMPYSSAAAPPGCSTCSNVPDGGVMVFAQ
jgi:hypothetical protein